MSATHGHGRSVIGPGNAVFLSYASQDAAAAKRIVDALRGARIEVWFDQSELRGGDAWDRRIRREIRDCALFLPVVSRNTDQRTEGYFRLEWHLADERSHQMARSRPFLFPVCIDDTPEKLAEVPESFLLVQWTRLPAGETASAFAQRVQQVLAGLPHADPPESPAGLESGDPVQPTPPRPSRRTPWLMGAAVLLTAVMLGWVAATQGYFWRDPLANAQFSRLTNWPGTEHAVAISRDGRTVAFVADHDGPEDVWVTETGSDRYLNLTHGAVPDLINPEIRALGFSFDGSLITIWARGSGGSPSTQINIVAVPASGGKIKTYLPEAAELAWSNDGRRIVYHTTAPGDPMFVADSPAGAARRVYAGPVGMHCHFPVWSPDDAFIYFARGVPPDHWDLWRIRPDGSGAEQLTFHNSVVTHPVLLDRHTLLYLATDGQGAGPWLYAIDVRRRVPHRISVGLERYTSLAAAADGSRLAVTVAHPSTGLWQVPLPAGGELSRSAVRVASDFATGRSPRSGLGYLLYVSERAGRPGIWKFANGRSRELWAGSPDVTLGAPAIASDGRIAFTVSRGGERTSLQVIEPDGTRPVTLADSLPLRGKPAWAPDGGSVVIAQVEGGEPNLTRFFLDGRAPLPLVQEYSSDPAWSLDGQFLIYAGADTGTVFPLRAAGADGRPYPLLPLMLPRGARHVVFAPDGHGIIVLRGEFQRKDFWSIDLRTGAEQRLTEFDPGFDIRDFDLSADKTQILFDRVEESSTVALIERAR